MTIEQYIAVICAGFSLLAVTFIYLAYKSEIEKSDRLKRVNLKLKERILAQDRQINFYKNIAAGAGIDDDDGTKRKIDSDLILSAGVKGVKGE